MRAISTLSAAYLCVDARASVVILATNLPTLNRNAPGLHRPGFFFAAAGNLAFIFSGNTHNYPLTLTLRHARQVLSAAGIRADSRGRKTMAYTVKQVAAMSGVSV